MANNFSGSPVYVDTAMTAGAGLGKSLQVFKVIWNNPTAAAQTFQITDTNTGKMLLEGYASSANQSQVFDFIFPFQFPSGLEGQNDWKVSTLGGGNLLIYFLE